MGWRWDEGTDSLFLWMATIIGLSSGWMQSRTGVPTRSWGRYPNRGTARSSTSWKRQLGVWLVVNILLSRGMRGAGGRKITMLQRTEGRREKQNVLYKHKGDMYPHILNELSLRWEDSRVEGRPRQSLVAWAGRVSVWTAGTSYRRWRRHLRWCDKTWTSPGCSPLVERLQVNKKREFSLYCMAM